MTNLVKLPGTMEYINPAHVVYVKQETPHTKGPDAGRTVVEVCVTMYGRYKTIYVYDQSVDAVAALINNA